MTSLRCLFVVQGEGRGHMTQALALKAILKGAGHRVAAALVGRSARREVPAFFLDGLGVPVHFFQSPNFVADAATRSVRVLPTLVHTTRHARRFAESLPVFDAAFARYRPDVVLNFFEPLAGLYYYRRRPAVPMVCLGHQYLAFHPAFPFADGRRVDRWALTRFAHLTSYGAARRLALSFYPAPDAPGHRLMVVPPLLRPELFRQPAGQDDGFLLAYVLNSGYADPFLRWHAANRHVPLHLFWDRPDAPDVQPVDATLTLHRLHGERFLAMMARCSGLACTAGFESICEAFYLGKPVLMVPVEGHYEQACNARDAERAGAGVAAPSFDLDRLVALTRTHRPPLQDFQAWVALAEDRFIEAIEGAVGSAAPRVMGAYGAS